MKWGVRRDRASQTLTRAKDSTVRAGKGLGTTAKKAYVKAYREGSKPQKIAIEAATVMLGTAVVNKLFKTEFAGLLVYGGLKAGQFAIKKGNEEYKKHYED